MSYVDEKQVAHQALVDHILTGEGRASAELRGNAFGNTNVPLPLRTLVEKVVSAPAEITDGDFAAAKRAAFTEDEIFEVVVAAAVGRSARIYAAGLTALAEAAG